MYGSLIRLRRTWYNNTRGLHRQHVNAHHVNNEDKLIAFHRWDNSGPGDDVIVVVNVVIRGHDSYNIGFSREGSWKVRFNSAWKAYSEDLGNQLGYDTYAHQGYKETMGFSANVGIAPYSALVLSPDE